MVQGSGSGLGGFAGALPLVAPAVFLVRLQVRHHAELLPLALHAREHSVWGRGNGGSGFEGLAVLLQTMQGQLYLEGPKTEQGHMDSLLFEDK